MKLDRRELLLLGGTLAVASGCSRIAERVAGRRLPSDTTVPADTDTTRRLLNRVGFGPVPGDIAKVKELGHAAYIEQQLNPSDEDDPMFTFLMSRLDVNRLAASDLRDLHEEVVLAQLRQSATLGPIYSRWQLQERMIDFWSNHFNIFQGKNYGTYRKATDNWQVIRKNALGNFKEMVAASAHSSAMLGYLDNHLNKSGIPNENYARELMELHTMGVYGGYTQKDISEVARCFTGWTIEDQFLRPREKFRFDDSVHDKGPKQVLGHKITKGGYEDGLAVLDIVSTHPATAQFLAKKLCMYFLGEDDEPTRELAAKAFLSSKGDIKQTLRPILESDKLVSGPPILKRPFDFAVSSIRSIGANCDGTQAFQDHLEHMGQALYSWPMPDGYPDRTSAWTGSLLGRWNFALALVSGKMGGVTLALEPLKDTLEQNILGVGSAIGIGDLATRAAIALASPSFQWR